MVERAEEEIFRSAVQQRAPFRTGDGAVEVAICVDTDRGERNISEASK
jgi:hypothetical protein